MHITTTIAAALADRNKILQHARLHAASLVAQAQDRAHRHDMQDVHPTNTPEQMAQHYAQLLERQVAAAIVAETAYMAEQAQMEACQKEGLEPSEILPFAQPLAPTPNYVAVRCSALNNLNEIQVQAFFETLKELFRNTLHVGYYPGPDGRRVWFVTWADEPPQMPHQPEPARVTFLS